MDFSGIKDAILNSPLFSIVMIVGIIIIGVAIRLILIPTNPEYKHRPDKE